jgi:hypothetical protein
VYTLFSTITVFGLDGSFLKGPNGFGTNKTFSFSFHSKTLKIVLILVQMIYLIESKSVKLIRQQDEQNVCLTVCRRNQVCDKMCKKWRNEFSEWNELCDVKRMKLLIPLVAPLLSSTFCPTKNFFFAQIFLGISDEEIASIQKFAFNLRCHLEI